MLLLKKFVEQFYYFIVKKIIFLDIDGVLVTESHLRNISGMLSSTLAKDGHTVFDPNAVSNLKKILTKTDAEIVISSTWRIGIGTEGMRKIWEGRNMPGNIIGCTQSLIGNNRGKEIQNWLDTNQCDSFVIIDDEDDMLISQLNNFVQTTSFRGLTNKAAEKAIKCLNA